MNQETDLVQFILALLGIIDGGLVAVVEQVTCCDKAVAAIVARAAGYENSVALGKWLEFEERLGDAETGELHQLID